MSTALDRSYLCLRGGGEGWVRLPDRFITEERLTSGCPDLFTDFFRSHEFHLCSPIFCDTLAQSQFDQCAMFLRILPLDVGRCGPDERGHPFDDWKTKGLKARLFIVERK